jgi:cell division protein FtsB
VSPTAPTFVTLNNQLNKAHHRIRQLEARETELVAHNRTLCALIEERVHHEKAAGSIHRDD